MIEIEAAELKSKLSSGEAIEVVDIRDVEDFESWHIPGSRNVPVITELGRDNDERGLVAASRQFPRDRPIVAVCRRGITARRAVEVLDGLGFQAINLIGGIRGWSRVWTEATIPLDSPEGASCVQIRRNGKGCLSYLFGASGEAAVVDPSVEIEAYTETAKRLGLTITRALETHVHADHLSRARELCRVTGATLHMPPNDRVTYSFEPLSDGSTLSVGGIAVEAIATPGHTGESTCYLLNGEVLLTGDTLFTENVGRPDLEKGDAGADAGARALYQSLRDRLLGRFENVRVHPAHHGTAIGFDGVSIGASLADIRSRLDLTRESEDAFARRIVESLGHKPSNHEVVVAVNEGRADLGGRDPLDLEAGPNRCAAG